MSPARTCHLLPFVLLFVATSHGTGEKDPDALLRAGFAIEPTTESIRALLGSLADTPGQIAAAERLFAELDSEEFLTRQRAQRRLEAMPNIPQAVLIMALESDSPEVVVRAHKLVKTQSRGKLTREVAIFTCLRAIADGGIGGLVPEILAVAGNGGAVTRDAAVAALVASSRPADEPLLRDALENPHCKLVAEHFYHHRRAGDRPAVPGWVAFFDHHLIHGNGEGGHQTDFLKGISAAVEACFEIRTRTANTLGSVASRRKTAAWLYPEDGWGEIPKVLDSDGRRHYPLWGSWQQHWRKGIRRLDENGALIKGGAHSGGSDIHSSSSVRYLILPLSE